MAAIRVTTSTIMVARSIIFRPIPLPRISFPAASPVSFFRGVYLRAPVRLLAVRCASTKPGAGEKKSPARMVEVQRLLYEAEERYKAAGGGVEPIPQITLDHVTVSYARSGGPGGQNVNKVNTKVDMRFNVKNAHWLSERVREKIMQMEKNRINKDGELVISSTKTRTQKSAAGEQKRLDKKKAQSQKKAQRRSRDGWD
ncbi:peptidyl-tRNA hydrolase ict1 mitochondrial [Phtheirospermum japonicum]|uniref:Peptidyl-tRNA hydrolase ict1 mitochondrial n=1 Tax=Phtheirospermum japonicum TaxID=374723 RepID=A0A830B7M4_9LAMI|nr:peptidyl-tRNA hydrolase ict1 mitochondrial [Phtheirospermum japonicum]